jgi:hypothetical protein
MACLGPDNPTYRDYSAETAANLQTQIGLAPDLFAAESEFRPKYAQLDADIMAKLLPQLLATYQANQPAMNALATEDQRARTAGEMDLIKQYGPDVTKAIRESSGNATLLDMLRADAESGLAAGGGLDPAMQAQLQQQMRGAQAGRGMMTSGNSAVSGEALYGAQAAQALKQQRFQNAQSVASQLQQTGGDPFLALLGRPSQTLAMTQGMGNQANSFNPGNLFNPESGYAGNLWNSNYGTDWQFKQTDPSTIGKVGMVSDTVGSFAGSIMKGFMGCWVAREVYGEQDARWLIFRQWLLGKAPVWLRKLYLRHGEAFAAWISTRPRAKRVVRWLMDMVITQPKVKHA